MTTKKANAKEEYRTADFLKVASLSGSSLKTSTAANSGVYPVTYKKNSGTPFLVSAAYTATAKTYGDKILADILIGKLTELTKDNYAKFPNVKKVVASIKGKDGKSYRNEKRLISDLRNKTNIGGILSFSPSGETVRGSLLSESDYNELKKIL